MNVEKPIWEVDNSDENDILAMGQELFGEEFIDYIPLRI